MSTYRELLIGCGHKRDKRIHHAVTTGSPKTQIGMWNDLTTLDNNPECKPDILFDLSEISIRKGGYSIPSDDNFFDEIHGYEVLEHVGAQGDYALFFAQFREFYRTLKPGGYFCATVPDRHSPWAWGDPGHTRVISRCTLVFLDKDEYARQVGVTSMSDYRKELGDTNFRCVFTETKQETFRFVLQAIK